MVERKEVEALLAEAEQGDFSKPHSTVMEALCRAWLALQDAPIRIARDDISYGVSVAGTGVVNGQHVRIVKEGE